MTETRSKLTTLADPLKGYMGAKAGSGVAARIISQMPPHYGYFEIFAGSAAVARLKRPANLNVLNDLDYNVIADLKMIPAFKGERWLIQNLDAIKLLENGLGSAPTKPMLMYLDPPYPACVRRRNRYKYDLRNDDWHRGFCLGLSRLKCMVMVSSYPNAIYDDLLAGWRAIDISTVNRAGPCVERLWMNYPEPTYLHDPRFAGQDRRERWKIAKRVQRWKKKYLAAPPAERQLMYAELAAADLEVVRLQERE